MDGKTKRQASKDDRAKQKLAQYNPEFVEEILRAQKVPPEKTFKNLDELMQWLDQP